LAAGEPRREEEEEKTKLWTKEFFEETRTKKSTHCNGDDDYGTTTGKRKYDIKGTV